MHLADAFIQNDLHCIQVIHFLSVYVFPGNRTHNLYAANAMLYHWATGTLAQLCFFHFNPRTKQQKVESKSVFVIVKVIDMYRYIWKPISTTE